MPGLFRRLEYFGSVVNALADGFLCLCGIVLLYWGVFSVDIPAASYLIILAGGLFFCSGCWFYRCGRQCRKKADGK